MQHIFQNMHSIINMVRQYKPTSVAYLLRRCQQASDLLLNIKPHMVMTFIFVRQPLAYVAKNNPSIGFKYLGSYLAMFLSRKSRLAILKHHYLALLKHTNTNFIKNIVDGQIELWTERHDQDAYAISLSTAEYVMEGELALLFSCNAQTLFTMTFTIAPGAQLRIASENILFIGGVQGAKGHYELIKHSTKMLHDICPRALLMEAIQAIAIAMKIPVVVGICAGEQSSFRLTPSVGTSLNDYDYLWQNHGGEKINDQVYRLPIPFVYKPLSSVKRSHRGRAQNRRKRRRAIMEQICQTFGDKCLIDFEADMSASYTLDASRPAEGQPDLQH